MSRPFRAIASGRRFFSIREDDKALEDPTLAISCRLDLESLLKTLNDANPAAAEACRLVLLEDFTHREAVRTTHINDGTLRNALDHLAQQMRKAGYE